MSCIVQVEKGEFVEKGFEVEAWCFKLLLVETYARDWTRIMNCLIRITC